MVKVISLLSGGLDSILATALVKSWGRDTSRRDTSRRDTSRYSPGYRYPSGYRFEVVGVTFKTPFWATGRAEKAAKILEIPLKIIDISKDHFEMLKSPPHGFGKNMNPCIDCHALMLKRAKGLMGGKGVKFIVTGEVLGERPFSQNKQALSIVEREAGVEGVLVRPLSGKLLPPTFPEKKGWIKREWLLDIQGRTRKKQFELAQKLGIKEFPTPAGGCLLTDSAFSERLKSLFENFVDPRPADAELLKYGRIFWENKTLIIIGRNDEENKQLEKLAQKGDVLIEMKDIPGPTALVRGKITDGGRDKAKKLVKQYSRRAKGKRVEWRIKGIGKIGVDKGRDKKI